MYMVIIQHPEGPIVQVSPEEDMGEFDSETLGDDSWWLSIEAVHSEQESSSDDSTDNDGYSQDDPTDDEEFYARRRCTGFNVRYILRDCPSPGMSAQVFLCNSQFMFSRLSILIFD